MKIKIREISSKYVDYKPFYGNLIVITAIYNILDTLLTSIFVEHGSGVEMNPTMNLLIEQGIGWFILFKLSMGALVFPIWWHIVLKNGVNAAKWPIWTCYLLYKLVIINNLIAGLMILYCEFL